jgi:hypothetical protein
MRLSRSTNDPQEQRDRTPDRPPNHDTGAGHAEGLRPERREAPARASRSGYAAALVWPLACLALYAWQLIGIAGG